jgi:hypothetical protein
MIAQSSLSIWFPSDLLIRRKFEIQVGVPRHAKHAGGLPKPRLLEGCPR